MLRGLAQGSRVPGLGSERERERGPWCGSTWRVRGA